MASSINASTTAGVVTTADTSGVLNIQTAGTTAISISASQAVSFTNSPTVTGGTANGVAYLNGSKVLTTGSALVFDGTNLGVGVTPVGLDSRFKNLEIGTATSLSAITVSSTSLLTYLQHNSYVDAAGATKHKAAGSNYASQYSQSGTGAHIFQSTSSAQVGGTACSYTAVLNQGGVGKTLALEGGTVSTGTGITFPATQSASSDANTLDDYEEGTYAYTANPDTGSITLTAATGYYTKIGRLVNIRAYVDVASVSSPTGNVYFTAPFPCRRVTAVGSIDAIGTFNSFSGNTLVVKIQLSQTIVYLQTFNSSTGGNGAAAAYLKAGSAFALNITYETD